MQSVPVRFAVIGINHHHIYGYVNLLLRAGAQFVAFYAPEPDLVLEFSRAYPQAGIARSREELLEDPSLHLIVSSGIPCDRAPLGIAAMQHGKDFMCDKPGFTNLAQLAETRRVQAATGRIYSVCYGERLEGRAAVRAGELVRAGAIGRVVQTAGLGPHRIHPPEREPWFFEPDRAGGILADIGTHQADQFLFYTGSTSATVVASQVANYNHPEHPAFEDFGDVIWRGDQGTGYTRVDWYTPGGLGVWGDGRMTILGTDGYIELRKYIDPAGRPGADHLFLVDGKGIRYINCSDGDLPYGRELVQDILDRTETAMSQAHCFLVAQLALEAEAAAARLGYLE